MACGRCGLHSAACQFVRPRLSAPTSHTTAGSPSPANHLRTKACAGLKTSRWREYWNIGRSGVRGNREQPGCPGNRAPPCYGGPAGLEYPPVVRGTRQFREQAHFDCAEKDFGRPEPQTDLQDVFRRWMPANDCFRRISQDRESITSRPIVHQWARVQGCDIKRRDSSADSERSQFLRSN